eukprot:scaffold1850_cov194-Pinguiococcus_pyrenoidosus.AAC.68
MERQREEERERERESEREWGPTSRTNPGSDDSPSRCKPGEIGLLGSWSQGSKNITDLSMSLCRPGHRGSADRKATGESGIGMPLYCAALLPKKNCTRPRRIVQKLILPDPTRLPGFAELAPPRPTASRPDAHFSAAPGRSPLQAHASSAQAPQRCCHDPTSESLLSSAQRVRQDPAASPAQADSPESASGFAGGS